MNAKRYVYAGSAIVLAGVLIFIYNAFHRPKALLETSVNVATPSYPVLETSRALVHLYFSGPDQIRLVAESRELPTSSNPAELGRTIVQALIDGPRKEGIRTLPASTAVRDVFVLDDGTAYVDFDEKVAEDHPGGVRTELLSIYSVVNSLVLNVEGISAVKLLIGGREADTLAGHMDLRFPYKADILLIK